MIKKTIKFTDYAGVERIEDFYFNYSKAELMEMELNEYRGDEIENGIQGDEKSAFGRKLQAVMDAKDGRIIISTFKEIIATSYGERSQDGKSFMKSEEITKRFEGTEAYSELFVELVTNADKSAEFIRGLVPQGLAEEAAVSAQQQIATEAKTASDLAREASQASLQGFNKKADHEGSDIVDVPFQGLTVTPAPDVVRHRLTRAELEAELAALDS